MIGIKKMAGELAVALHRTFGGGSSNRVTILAYHSVHHAAAGVPEAPFNVEPERFRQQMEGLLRRGYSFRSLEDLLDAHERKRSLPPRSLVVTFDDCFDSVYQHAWPVMREHRIPSTLFLATAFLDRDEQFHFDSWGKQHAHQLPEECLRPITVAACREMRASGLVELAAHTHTHRDFRGRPDDLQTDVEACLETLRRLFGVERPSFAFPYGRRHLGYAGGAMSEAARAAGVRCALTTDAERVDPLSDDPYLWGRFNVYNHDTPDTIAAKAAGWYTWVPQVQIALDLLRGRAQYSAKPAIEPARAKASEATASLPQSKFSTV